MDAGAGGELSKEHFVLVHGACHGAWCWFKLACLLRGSGHRVSCVDLAGAAGSLVDPNHVKSFDDYDAPLLRFMAALPAGDKVTMHIRLLPLCRIMIVRLHAILTNLDAEHRHLLRSS
jgi:pimeloyl-ACP methyl ester carboxylesterase